MYWETPKYPLFPFLSFFFQIFNQFSMASFPHNFYSDLYPNNFSDLQTLLMAAGDSGMCGIRNNNNNNNNIDLFVSREETFIPFFDQTVSPEQSSSDTGLSPFLTMQHPDLYGPVSDMTVPSLPEFNMSTYDIHSLITCQPQVPGTCNYGDELLGFVPELKPLYRDTWVINILLLFRVINITNDRGWSKIQTYESLVHFDIWSWKLNFWDAGKSE